MSESTTSFAILPAHSGFSRTIAPDATSATPCAALGCRDGPTSGRGGNMTRIKTGGLCLPRRAFLAGGVASFAFIGNASATPPATIVSGKTIGRGQMLVVHEDASGRIVAFEFVELSRAAQDPSERRDRGGLLLRHAHPRADVHPRRQGGDRDRCRRRQGQCRHQRPAACRDHRRAGRHHRRDVGRDQQRPRDAAASAGSAAPMRRRARSASRSG